MYEESLQKNESVKSIKSTVSARINSDVYEVYKELELPISLVIECSLINFLKLSDEEKILFINENQVDKADPKLFDKEKPKWGELITSLMKAINIPSSTITSLMVGSAVPAIGIIAGLITKIGIEVFANDISNRKKL